MSRICALVVSAVFFNFAYASIAAANPVTTLSFRLIDNRVFIPVNINGSGPHPFILDTGDPNWDMSVGLMRDLGIKPKKISQIDGAGENKQLAYEVKVQSAGVGSISFRDLDFFASDYSNMSNVIGFSRFDGAVGLPVFDKHIVECDFAKSQVRVFGADGYVVPADAIVIPFTLFGGYIPAVEGTIAGLNGHFVVDLGDRSSLTLFGPFWRTHRLDAALGPVTPALTGYGIGGPVRGALVRVQEFKLGSAEVKSVVARLSSQKSGAFADRELAGSIGTGILKRFRVAFDYPGRRIVLVREPSLDVPDRADRSGLWLGLQGTNFRVYDVIPGSAGMKAGLEVGDIVTSVDGTPTAKLDIFALRERLRDPSVAAVLFGYQRGTSSRSARLTLHDILPRG